MSGSKRGPVILKKLLEGKILSINFITFLSAGHK